MTTRTYCLLDPGAAGAGLSINDGGTILTTNANALNLSRAAFGTIPARKGTYRFEAYAWSNSRGDMTGKVSIGIARIDAPLNAAVGSNAMTYGLMPADGVIKNNGSNIKTIDAIAERACIGVEVTLSPSSASVSWLLNGSVIHTQSLSTGQAWLPAFSIASPLAGDVSIVTNFGQNRFDGFPASVLGWYTESPGLSILTLALAREGFLSATGDTLPNRVFRPAILNPESFSIKHAPLHWTQRAGHASASSSAYSVMRLDNSAGIFDLLIDRDVRDALLLVQSIKAPEFSSGTLADADTALTACIDAVSAPSASVVEVRLRGTLARLAVPLRCRVIPPFADESNRGRIYPVGIGAQRNVRPLLIDVPPSTGRPVYALGDAAMTNVTLVADGGAALDPLATPPQWSSALNGAGIQLQTSPVMRLSADCSTVGTQYEIPGADDVLNGDGGFQTWSGGVPHGWRKAATPEIPSNVVSNGTVSQTSSYGGTTPALMLTSQVALSSATNGSYLGYPIILDSTPLQPGRTYRITLKLLYTLGTPDQFGQEGYGLIILTKRSRNRKYWISDHLTPLRVGFSDDKNFTFVYTVPPSETSPLGLYLCCVSGINSQTPPTSAGCTVVVDDVRVQLLGQYVALPLEGMTLTQAFREILVNRAGEPEGIFSASDTQAIDDETGIRIGARWTEAPNIADALQEICDTFGAVIYEDYNNVIRVRRFRDANRPDAIVVADFTRASIVADSIRIEPDTAEALTTQWGCRRNSEPLAPGDFVTDTATVPPTQREAWSGNSQIRFTTSARPSSEYSFAIGAPWFHTLADDPETIRPIAEETVAMYGAAGAATDAGRNSTDAAATPSQTLTGKRKRMTFEALFEDDMVGETIQTHWRDLGYGDAITVDLGRGAVKRMTVVEWESVPFASPQRIRITGNYR